MKRAKTIFRSVLPAAAALAACAAGCGPSGDAPRAPKDVRYVAMAATRADVVSTIAASGTLEPEELVDVGSQVSGQIVAFGTDRDGAEVDYCSAVTNGMEPDDTLATVADNILSLLEISTFNNWKPKEG